MDRPVSRETGPGDGPDAAASGTAGTRSAAAALFGAALPRAEQYADWLAGAGVERGLIGPREADRLWDRHLLNCAAAAPAFPASARVADIGSGAGLPGVVLALARPDLDLTLVESLRRRADFLTETVALLDLTRVRVVRDRAEALAADLSFDVVTARAVAPLGRLARWCLPLTAPGGSLLAFKGARAEDELEESVPVLRSLGATGWGVEHYPLPGAQAPTTLVRVTAGPRPSGTGRPARRPRAATGAATRGRSRR